MKPLYKLPLILIVFSFFYVNENYAQDLDDNLIEFKSIQDSIGKYYVRNKRLSIDYAKKLVELSKANHDTAKTIMSLHFIGRQNQNIGEYKESVRYFEQELTLFDQINTNHEKYNPLYDGSFTKIEVLAQLGQNYEFLGQIEKAFNLFNQCVEIAKKENLEFYKAVMPSIIGDLYNTKGDYKQALRKHKESLHSFNVSNKIDLSNKVFNKGLVTFKMSETYLKLNQKDSALWILKQGLKEKLDTLDLGSKIGFTAQHGKVFLAKNEYKKALKFLLEARTLSYKYDSISAPASVSLELGECYYALKEFEKATSTLEKGIVVKKESRKEIYLTEDYKLLAKVYKASGNLEKSNTYFEKYILNQEAFEKSKDTISSSFHTQELSNIEDEKSAQKSKFNMFMSIGLALLLTLLACIIYLVNQKKKNTKKFNSLLLKFNQQETSVVDIIDTKDNVLEEKTTSEVNQETTEQILSGLQNLKDQEYFLRQDCNSYNVAKKIKTNTSYLSKVINSHFEKNFNTYINDLRINYAVLRLKNDSRFRSFSVQSIAEELGYKSADSFTKYFKLRTGLNPSFYIKQLNSLT